MKTLVSEKDGIGTVALSQKLNIHKSTVSRILKAMAKHQLVGQDPETKKYVIGGLAFEIGNTAIRSINNRILSVARPHIDELRNTLKRPVALEAFSGRNTVLLYMADISRRIRFSFEIGMRLPAHASSGAKAILSFSNMDNLDLFVGDELKKYTNATITDKEEYKRRLIKTRETGVAYDHGEIDKDIHTMAVPVFNHVNKPVAAIVIGISSDSKKNSPEAGIIELMNRTARLIQTELGS